MEIEVWYAALRPDGEVAQFENSMEDDEGPNPLHLMCPGLDYHKLVEKPNLPPQPSPTCKIKLVEGVPSWVEEGTLEELRAWKWGQLKAARTAAELEDFEFEGKMYQANKEQINGYVTMAMIALQFGQPFSQQWTLKDNSVETFNAQRMIALGVVLGNRVASVYSRGRALRAQIDAPDITVEQLHLVQWSEV